MTNPRGSLFLRESRARRPYTCAICDAQIPRGTAYYRDEPHPQARVHRGKMVQHICYRCVHGNPLVPGRELAGMRQTTLPLSGRSILAQTRVELIDVTAELVERLAKDPSLLQDVGPERLEDIICNRFGAMGLIAQKVGSTFERDGGVDVVFYPKPGAGFPYLGAVQVKYHRQPNTRTDVATVRDFAGVMSAHPFDIGIVVTNTTFTPDARWFANQRSAILRLRDMEDLRRWLCDNFTDEEEWRDLPQVIEIAPGVRVTLPWRRA